MHNTLLLAISLTTIMMSYIHIISAQQVTLTDEKQLPGRYHLFGERSGESPLNKRGQRKGCAAEKKARRVLRGRI